MTNSSLDHDYPGYDDPYDPPYWHSHECRFSSGLTGTVLVYFMNLIPALVFFIFLCSRLNPFKRTLSAGEFVLCGLAFTLLPALPLAYTVLLLWDHLEFLFSQAWYTRSWRFLYCALLGMPAQKPDGTLVSLTKVTAEKHENLRCITYQYSRAWFVRTCVTLGFGCGLLFGTISIQEDKTYLFIQTLQAKISGILLLIGVTLVLVANCRWELESPTGLRYRDEPEGEQETLSTAGSAIHEQELGEHDSFPNFTKQSFLRRVCQLFDQFWPVLEGATLIFVIFAAAVTSSDYSARDIEKIMGQAPVKFITALFMNSGGHLDDVRHILYILVPVLWVVSGGVPIILSTALLVISQLNGPRPWIDAVQSKLMFWRKWFVLPALFVQLVLFHFVFMWVRVGLGYGISNRNCDFSQWDDSDKWGFCKPCSYWY